MPLSAASHSERLPPLLVICGPTAAGKTELSLALAELIAGTEIVSADSRQVYRGMDIGTAKAFAAERARVPHHGLDLVDPDTRFTAADYRRAATEALHGIAARGGLAVLVGGTGLYLRAIGRQMALDETGHDPAIRAELEEQLMTDGLAPLVADLERRAPQAAAKVDLNNPRRVVRALERARIVGDKPPPAPKGYPAPVAWLGLDVPIPTHEIWIAHRAQRQFKTGLLAEAQRLRTAYDPSSPAFSAMGYREAFGVLDKTLTHDQAIAQTVLRTRQFARRQRTWFRREPGVEWHETTEPKSVASAAFETARRLLAATD